MPTEVAPERQRRRDDRIDCLRGAALLTIFVDHVPGNLLGAVTMRNWSFCDAAEIFVLLAGYASMLAYGRAFGRDGVKVGLYRVAARCFRIYLFQVGLLLGTMLTVRLWTGHFGLQPLAVGPLLRDKMHGVMRGVTLEALPTFLDILPLYIVLLALFPLIYLLQRISRLGTLAASLSVWQIARIEHLNIPNLTAPEQPGVWFFDPFTWQLVFTIGVIGASIAVERGSGSLPRIRPLIWLSWIFVLYAAVATIPWGDAIPGFPAVPSPALDWQDKTYVSPWRLIDVLAVAYVVLTSSRMARWAAGYLWPVTACGRHSLEVFSTGTILALFSRLIFRTYGTAPPVQILVNVMGFAAMIGVGLLLERMRHRARQRPALMQLAGLSRR